MAERTLWSARAIVVRAEPELANEVLQVLDDLRVPAEAVGLLDQPTGQPASVSWSRGAMDQDDVLWRCRRVELGALLEWGRAVWRPETYHYRLPSGRHAGVFVKAGDAIRRPRDAHVLASWVAADLRAGTGIVVDTGTLTALVTVLESRMREAGFPIGPLEVLDDYPHTQLDVSAVVNRAAQLGSVCAILSVNSSGTVRDLMVAAMKHVEPDAAVHVLVDRSSGPAADAPPVRTWLTIDDGGLQADAECRLCTEGRRTRLVHIDPSSFDGRIAPEPQKLMLDIGDPMGRPNVPGNQSFWELCHQEQAIRLQDQPDPHVRPFRPPTKALAVHVLMDRLAASPNFATAIGARIDRLASSIRRDLVRAGMRSEALGSTDVVLVPDHDIALGGFRDQIWPALRDRLGPDAVLLSVPVESSWEPEVRAVVKGAATIVAVTLGSVSGRTLQRLLVQVQDARRGTGDYAFFALCVHARPVTKRQWRTLRNSFGGALFACWLSYLPNRSPLDDELDRLNQVSADQLRDDVKDLLDQRRRICSTLEGAHVWPRPDLVGQPDLTQEARRSFEQALFLGAAPDARITPHSIFGHELDAVTTFVAVGAAMQRSRVDITDTATPSWRVFDLPNIVRSYYDPLILCAIFRWLAPYEAWWGSGATDAEPVVTELLQRSEEGDLTVLLPELLLAAARGKVPASGVKVLRQWAAERDSAAVQLGLALVDAAGL